MVDAVLSGHKFNVEVVSPVKESTPCLYLYKHKTMCRGEEMFEF